MLVHKLAIPLIVLASALAPATHGQTPIVTENQLLLSPSGQSETQFGRYSATDGDWLIVSAIQDDTYGFNAGAVYVFQRGPSGYTATQTLAPPTGQSQLQMGAFGIAIQGDVIAVTASRYLFPNGSRGAVFLYRNGPSGWALEETLALPGGGAFSAFGSSCCFTSDGSLLVGAPGSGPGSSSDLSGRVYRFTDSMGSWALVQEIVIPRPAFLPQSQSEGRVGIGLACDGDRAVVVCELSVFSPNHVVAAMERLPSGDWTPTQTWEIDSVTLFNVAAVRVEIHGDWLALGSYLAAPPYGGGRVILYEYSAGQWNEYESLQASDSQIQLPQAFGVSLDLEGDQLLVGAPGLEYGGQVLGAAYRFVFDGSGWNEVARYRAANPDFQVPAANGSSVVFANSVAIVADSLAASATTPDVGGLRFYYDHLGTQTCSPVPNSTGAGSMLALFGSTQAATGQLFGQVSDLPAGQAGILLAGTQTGFVMNPGGSQGNLCLGGSLARFNQSIYFPDSNGQVEIPIDMGQIPTNPAQPILAGQTWHFQYWTRDFVNGASTSNFSSARAVMFD